MVPFSSVDAFRYVWIHMKILGFDPPARYRTLYTIYAIVINIMVFAVLPAQEIGQAFLVESLPELLRNLSVSLEWVCGCIKYFGLVRGRHQLRDSHSYIESLDARVQRDPEELAVMKRIVKNCHLTYVLYNVCFWCNLLIITINAVSKRQLIFESYIPWDWRSSTKRLTLTLIYQFLTCLYHVLLCLTNDYYVVIYLYVTLGHLETLGMRISRIGYDRNVSQEDNYKELIKCIHDHRNLLQFFEQIRPLISWTIFIQITVTAFALCLTTFYFVFFDSDIVTLLVTLIYFGVLFAQVLPCCNFMNMIMTASDDLTTALYFCNWTDQTQKFRKTVIIFMQRTQTTIIIVAGNLIPVSLQTFITILRFSFSLFTLLSQLKDVDT